MLRRIPPELARKQVFTIDEAENAFNVERKSLRVILSRMEDDGSIERLERGKYMVIPLSARKGRYTLNEFVIGSKLVEPYSISYWSAMNYHGLTEQISNTVFLQTPSRKKRRNLNIFGVRYLIIKISRAKFFGMETVWIENTPVNITDKEKTIADCLDRPEYCGGVIEVAKALNNDVFDYDRLSCYTMKMGNSGVIRRLGYLCDHLGIPIDLPVINSRNYLYLDPTMSKKGDSDRKWRLKVNLNLGELE